MGGGEYPLGVCNKKVRQFRFCLTFGGYSVVRGRGLEPFVDNDTVHIQVNVAPFEKWLQSVK